MPRESARPIIFGEVLFDRFPDGAVVLGGAPFNVAWHLQAFGQRPLFVSRVGDDPLGRQIRERMLHWGMDCAGLQLDSVHPTGTVEVSLIDDEPSYEIVSERAYDHVTADYFPPLSGSELLYHGTLALRGVDSRAALERLRHKSALSVFIDVNLRPPWYTLEQTRALLKQARWAKLNEDELGLLAEHGSDLEQGTRQLQADCDLDLLVVTRGAGGAIARTAEGHLHAVQPARDQPVVDTVGAGDAFASVLILGLLRDWPLGETLERAQVFASGLVGVRGATVDQPEFYAEYRRDWGLG